MVGQVDEWGRVRLTSDDIIALAWAGKDAWSMPCEQSADVIIYNEWCEHFGKNDFVLKPLDHPVATPEEDHERRAKTWLISEDIRTIPVREFLLGLCKTELEIARVNDEMDLYESRDLIPLLQLMMYLVDHFRRNKIVWGVGRGSSVASYVLYLIGVHRIDSIKYNLSVTEFLKDDDHA